MLCRLGFIVLLLASQEVKSDFKWQTNLIGGSATTGVILEPFIENEINLLKNITRNIMKTRLSVIWNKLNQTEEGRRCTNDLSRLTNGFYAGEKWALQTYDSWGKFGNGLVGGYFLVRGRMSLCLKAKPPHSPDFPDYSNQFCWIDLTLHLFERFPVGGQRSGFCMPKSCSYDQLQSIFNYPQAYYNWIPYAPYFRIPFCYNPSVKHFTTTSETISIIIIIILFSFLIIATLYDSWIRLSKWSYRKSAESSTVALVKEYNLIEEADRKGKLSSETTMFVIEEGNDEDEIEVFEKQPLPKREELTDTDESEEKLDTPEKINGSRSHLLCFADPTIKIFNKPGLFGSILLSFSVVTNFLNLMKITNERKKLDCLNGIRFFSTCWVVMGHTVTHLYPNSDNPLGLGDMSLRQKLTTITFGGGVFGVDSFFVLSGLLVTYLFMKDRQNGKKLSWFRFYLDRYMRLSPANFFMLFVLYYGILGNNPQGPTDFFLQGMKRTCRSNWWYYVIYINNFLNPECFGIDWYMGNDMQFFCLAPIFLLLFMFIGKWVAVIFAGLIVASVGVNMAIVTENDFVHKWNLFYRPQVYPHQVVLGPLYHSFYIRPYCRIGAYLIGMYVGYLAQAVDLSGKLSKVKVALLWTMSLLCLSFTLYFTVLFQNLPSTVIYLIVSTGHYIWSLGLGILIFLCASNYGGIINSFLSWPGWQPVSRLSYSVYLMHFIAMKLFYFHTEETFHTSISDLITHFCSLIQYDVLGAMFLYFLVEAPFINLWKFTKT